jgi:hypothetical protein
MWSALEGFIVILALIFIFGVLSLPPRVKKERVLANRATTISNGAAGSTISVDGAPAIPVVDVQQVALNDSYTPDQKIATPEAAKVK